MAERRLCDRRGSHPQRARVTARRARVRGCPVPVPVPVPETAGPTQLGLSCPGTSRLRRSRPLASRAAGRCSHAAPRGEGAGGVVSWWPHHVYNVQHRPLSRGTDPFPLVPPNTATAVGREGLGTTPHFLVRRAGIVLGVPRVSGIVCAPGAENAAPSPEPAGSCSDPGTSSLTRSGRTSRSHACSQRSSRWAPHSEQTPGRPGGRKETPSGGARACACTPGH